MKRYKVKFSIFIHLNVPTEKFNPNRPSLLCLHHLHRASLHFVNNKYSVATHCTLKQNSYRTMVSMATTNRIQTYQDFAKVHGILLAASGLPESLHRRLFQKLFTETFDGGEHFQIEPCEDGRTRRLVFTSDSMAKDSNVFLIDHAWTFRLPDAYKQVLAFLQL